MTATNAEQDAWYWCLRHKRVEDSDTSCPADERLGPYESADAAEHWQDRTAARNERWDKEDEEERG